MEGMNGAMVAPQQTSTTQPTTIQSASTDALLSTTAGTTPSPAVPTPTTQHKDINKERDRMNGDGGTNPP